MTLSYSISQLKEIIMLSGILYFNNKEYRRKAYKMELEWADVL